jgi:hypothetical protein
MDPLNALREVTKVLGGVVKASFGPGALGRLGTVFRTVVVCLTLIGLPLAYFQSNLVVLPLVGIILLAWDFLRRGFKYVDQHPAYAAMDGAQITKVLTQDSALKNLPGVIDLPFETVATENPKALERRERECEEGDGV